MLPIEQFGLKMEGRKKYFGGAAGPRPLKEDKLDPTATPDKKGQGCLRHEWLSLPLSYFGTATLLQPLCLDSSSLCPAVFPWVPHETTGLDLTHQKAASSFLHNSQPRLT